MDINYYERAIKLLKKEDGQAEHLIRHILEMAEEEEVNNWFLYGKPQEPGKLENILGEWAFNIHKGLRQVDIFHGSDGHLDMALWNAIQLSQRWFDVFSEIVLPALNIESTVVPGE